MSRDRGLKGLKIVKIGALKYAKNRQMQRHYALKKLLENIKKVVLKIFTLPNTRKTKKKNHASL